jgi:hypothetical protein
MSISKSTVMRTVLLAGGCAALAAALALLALQHVVSGFLLAFAGLSTIAMSETSINYETRFTARSFIDYLRTERAYISALGSVCDAASYLCLAAALISWVALR